MIEQAMMFAIGFLLGFLVGALAAAGVMTRVKRKPEGAPVDAFIAADAREAENAKLRADLQALLAQSSEQSKALAEFEARAALQKAKMREENAILRQSIKEIGAAVVHAALLARTRPMATGEGAPDGQANEPPPRESGGAPK